MRAAHAFHVAVLILLLDIDFAFIDGKCLFAEFKIVEEVERAENPPVLTSTGHCVSKEGVAWIFGGIQYYSVNHHSDISDQLWSYETQLHSWRIHQKKLGSDQWPSPRHSSILCCGEDYLILYGGQTLDSTSLKDLWIFDKAGGMWTNPTEVSTSTSYIWNEHLRLLNSRSTVSWCWNDSLWYINNINDNKTNRTHGQFQVVSFTLAKMQWELQNITNSGDKRKTLLGSYVKWSDASSIVLGSTIWFFPLGSTPVPQDEVQVWSFSMESFHQTFHLFQIESQCSTSLENGSSDIIDGQNESAWNYHWSFSAKQPSSFQYENATIILGRKTNLSQIWSFDTKANKIWLSTSCNSILSYGRSADPCVLENSSHWFYDDMWYSHGGILQCENNRQFYIDNLCTVESSFMAVCNETNVLSAGVLFMLILFSLSSIAIFILCCIVLRKCVNGPYLKPPVHYGKAIRYSQLALDEIT
ncbi:uncharacterized protein LOC117121395 [Anneissia japonica]|uniref:uncharacterized protein LOC117121395 n=1 Tax=Anneissia japonica TaxID=1529436 RepID=UPI0014257C75|nr:uncharacterized protein LOC117121395 [Anneissia japonica]XP_033122497.1 uncharacterized protein LOC117121395 [Anneissia japonica]